MNNSQYYLTTITTNITEHQTGRTCHSYFSPLSFIMFSCNILPETERDGEKESTTQLFQLYIENTIHIYMHINHKFCNYYSQVQPSALLWHHHTKLCTGFKIFLSTLLKYLTFSLYHIVFTFWYSNNKRIQLSQELISEMQIKNNLFDF
jgi:hypothetical protein